MTIMTARASDPDTSHEAAAAVTGEKTGYRIARMLLAYLDHGRLTAHEAAVAGYGGDPGHSTPSWERTHSTMKRGTYEGTRKPPGRALVSRVGARPGPPSGMRCEEFELTDFGREIAAHADEGVLRPTDFYGWLKRKAAE